MKLTNTYLIGKHLKLLQGFPLTEICALCSQDPDGKLQGMSISEVIGDSFMDSQFVGQTGHICIYCAACMGKSQGQNEFIKNYNFIATSSKLKIFKQEDEEKDLVMKENMNCEIYKRSDLWNEIMHPPQEPFVFGVTFSHKKHISFKAPVNLPGNSYQIQTENYTVNIKLDENLKMLMSYMQNWYSVNKDVSTQPTWFIKDEIRNGTHRYGVIEKYGIEDYLREDALLKKYRGTGLLDLLTSLLNKGSFNPRRKEII